ncbi:hypothetical protein CBR_g23975 [Chara braunii]|uniref:Integrase catalytic domain-containing protein n=1 Tax=Chara braunii TaxID=69332 RepID=A0A388L5E3_CHABU|nr:hypothetical protein CBR_g23975 [Chara braunii]|eukprot:GBG77530.1 hypothetical protein CBR_g23975 [Chara braunii]
MARRRTFLEERPLGIEPPREVPGGIEVSLPAASGGWHRVADWVGVELAENMVYLVTKVEWRANESGEWNPDPQGHVRAEGRLYMSEDGWREFGVMLASGEDPLSMFEGAWQLVWQAGIEFADPGMDDVTSNLRVTMVGSFELPSENVRMRLSPFLLERLGGVELVRRAVVDLATLTYEDTMIHREYYRAFLEMEPFSGKQKYEVLRTLRAVFTTRPRAPVVGDEVLWGVARRKISQGMTYVDDLHRLRGKEMATEEGIDDQQSGGNRGTNGDGERNEGSARDGESAKLEGTREDGKDASIGKNSGKAGSKRGPQENREGGNDMRTSPRNLAGATPKKTKVLDACRKLAEIEKQTAEFKARLIEQMMVEDEEDPQGAGSREGRGTGQDEARYEGKDNSHKGMPSKKGKDKNDPPTKGTKNVMTPPAIDSGTSRLPATPKVTGACDGLWSLRERVLGWFDPEGTPKTREKQRESKEGEGTSEAGEAGSSEGGLKRIVTTLTRALNKNQGYLADAKKKLTFDGANITEFLIDYENLAALLKWTEEEKMEHLGQHVSLSLGRDIMAIVASSGSWKETRNEMMRKYLKAEKMATEAELAAVQRKNYATYNDFLRAFTLVALRIPGTSKFEYMTNVDFSTVTDLAEKTVVTETLALLKEGEVIDLTGKMGDKVKKEIESLHERVHGVDSKMERMENALSVMQAQVSRPALPPQEAVVPTNVANRGFGKRDPTNEQCKYCTMIGHFVRACPRLNHDIERQRCSRSLKGEILGPRGERVNWNWQGGMRRAVILLNNLEIVVVEAEPIAEIVWDQPRGRGPQANFILEGNGQDRVNITTRRAGAEKKLIRDTVMEETAGASADQEEAEAGEQEKVYGKTREEEPVDKATAAKKKFRYQIPILTLPELDNTLSKLLGTMVSVSFQTMLQASPRLLKGLRQLLTRKRVEVEEAPEPQEQGTEEAEAPQGVSNLRSIPGGLEDLEKVFADIRLNLPDREGGEVMRAPPGTKLSFHALPIGKLKIQIGTHHTDALVDGDAGITLIRRDFATITGCTVNKEVAGSIRGVGGEIPFTGYVTKCAVRAGIRESIWSFQRMTVMEEMNHDIILGRPWCANVEMIGMHLHDGTYMVDIEDPVTGRGELLRLLGTGGDPPKGKLATWSPTFEESARKGAIARMEGMREGVKIMIEEAFTKKEWIKMGLPLKKRRQEDEALKVMVAEKESEVELGASLPKPKEGRNETSEVVLEIPALLQLVKAIRYHKVGVDPTTLARFGNGVQKGYCLNGKLVSIQPHVLEHECWNDKGLAYEFGIAAKITDLLRAKIDSFVAEPTTSPYANKWFVFRKPNKTLRWIQDLQKLNGVTIRDAGSLPQADLLAESHAGRSIYSLVDLYSGYNQLSLDARDRPYTAMHTPVGQLQMQVTPMSFINVVAEAQRRMLAVTGDMFPEKCEPYIDDNPVKGARYKDETEVEPGVRKFVWDHPQDIKDFLQRFLLYNITASGPKSILAVPEVTILVFRCGAYGRRPDPAKTDKISQWPTPMRTTIEVRAFLGVVGFWRIFIKGFAKIAEPIRAMIREGGTIDWTEDREEAAQTLKDILSSDQVILAAPCFNDEVGRPFILDTDGGPMTVGGVLIQKSEEGKERPIRFESRTLNSAKRRYSQFKKEVLAILHCLKTFQAYMFGRRFILRINPTNVAGALKNYKPIDPTIGRWTGFIWQFDYKVDRITGLRNRADGLSRVCITPEGIEDAEPIDAFLDYEGGTLVVDNEMADSTLTTGQLLIQTFENSTPAVVAELREGPVTTVRRKEEKDSWGAEVGAREELMAMAVEGGRDAVMTLAETWGAEGMPITEPYHPDANAPVERGHRTLKNTIAKLAADNLGNWPRYLKQAVFSENMTPKRTTGCIPAELWYGREIDFPVEALVPTWNGLDDNPHLTTEELITTRCQQVAKNEEALEEVVNRVTDSRMKDKARWDQVKNIRKEPLQGERKQGTRGPSPPREGEPIVLPSESDTSREEQRNPGKRPRLEKEESIKVIDLSSGEEEDEVTTPTREDQGREEDPGEEKDPWKREFGPTFSD